MRQRLLTEEPQNQDIRALTLDTALRLFTEKGFFNTSMQDIRKDADVSIGSIYHYFKSKESLAQALYHDLVGRFEKAVEEIMLRHASTHDRAQAVTLFLLEMAENSPQGIQFIFCAKHREFLPCEKPLCASRPFELIRDMVATGIERGELCELNPVVATASLFGGVIRLIHLKLDGALEGSLPDYFDEIWQCAWASVT